jgi:predicted amidophosphoribosyltransferase
LDTLDGALAAGRSDRGVPGPSVAADHQLDAAERAANLSGAFTLAAVRAPPPGTILVVVDDIVTTGATLVEAAACLSTGFDLGQAQLTAAVVAATQRHRAV